MSDCILKQHPDDLHSLPGASPEPLRTGTRPIEPPPSFGRATGFLLHEVLLAELMDAAPCSAIFGPRRGVTGWSRSFEEPPLEV